MIRHATTAAVLSLALLSATAPHAAEVLYSFLDPDADNVFDVFVEVAGDDTLGLATYNIGLEFLDDFGVDPRGVSFTPSTLSAIRADDFTLTGFNSFLSSPVGEAAYSSMGTQWGADDPLWGVGMAPISVENVDGSELNLGAPALLGSLDLGTDQALSLDELHTIFQPSAAVFDVSGSTYEALRPDSFVTFGTPEERRSNYWRPAPDPVEPAPVVTIPVETEPPAVLPPVDPPPLEPVVMQPGSVEPETTPTETDRPELETVPEAPVVIEPVLPPYSIDLWLTSLPVLSPTVIEPSEFFFENVELRALEVHVEDRAVLPIPYTDVVVFGQSIVGGEPFAVVPEPGAGVLAAWCLATGLGMRGKRRIPHG